MQKENTISVNRYITYQMFEDWIVTALEGGSNYWYFINNLPQSESEIEEMPFSMKFAHLIWKEKKRIDVYDLEDRKNQLGTIDLKSVKKALEMVCENHEEVFNNLMDENYDAIDADVLFQYAVMGELIFG
jgi:hypothetical protein